MLACSPGCRASPVFHVDEGIFSCYSTTYLPVGKHYTKCWKRTNSFASHGTEEEPVLENYRHPGEFEPQSDVFMEWIPDAYQMKGYDNSRSCAEIVKALQEFGA